MTPQQLKAKWNDRFLTVPFPKQEHVDADTYAQVCQLIFTAHHQQHNGHALISLGINDGIMFAGVELILDIPKLKIESVPETKSDK